MVSKFTCALTGAETEGEELEGAEDDGLGDLPANWTKVTIQRRRYNPRWLTMMLMKQRTVESLMAQTRAASPEPLTEEQEHFVQTQVNVAWYAYESSIPVYELDEETVFIAESEEALDPWNSIRNELRLPPIEEQDENEDDEEEADPT